MKNIFSEKLILIHQSGDELYPVRMKNRDTGKIAFRLSKKGNTKLDSIEVEDEALMIFKVLNERYMVRARTKLPINRGGRAGLYHHNERSIKNYRLS